MVFVIDTNLSTTSAILKILVVTVMMSSLGVNSPDSTSISP